MTSSKQKFYALAAEHGIGIDYESLPGHGYLLTLDAPDGKWFQTSACAVDCSLTGQWNEPINWGRALTGLREIVAAGLCDAEDDGEAA